MHIPSTMLNTPVCAVTLAVGVAGGAAAFYFAKRQEDQPAPARFAAVTAMIFALQMLNFTVQDGTSGHLLGGMLAVALLGIPYAVLSIALVLVVQAVFFADGGINALGANVFNMGVIGAALAGCGFYALQKKMPRMLAMGLVSWASVILASFVCALQVALSGAVEFAKVVLATVSVHALIGLGEALLTVAVVTVLSRAGEFWKKQERAVAFGALAVAAVAALSSPFASSFPDGLEWVAGQLAFVEFAGLEIPALFPDYEAAFISSASFSTVLAGFAGIMIILAAGSLLGRIMKNGVPALRA